MRSVGPKTYKLLSSLALPQLPGELNYDTIVKLMKEHNDPIPSVIVQRFKFNSHVRRTETVREYVAELRKLSEHCEFGTNLEEMLRDRLVCGINNRQIQTKLLAEKNSYI